jgi:hypothetical protein
VDPTLQLLIALAFALAGTGAGYIFGRPRAPQPSVLAATDQVIAAMQTHMAQLTTEVGEARTEAREAREDNERLRAEYEQQTSRGTQERADLQRQIFDMRADVATAQAALLALKRSVLQEPPDVQTRILDRVPSIEPPKAGTGPLPLLPAPVRAVLPTTAQAPLLAMLLDATWVTGTREGRTLLTRDLPPDFCVTLERADDAKTDLVVLLDRCAVWPVLDGERSLLSRLLDTGETLIPPSTQVGQALRAWRDQWKL